MSLLQVTKRHGGLALGSGIIRDVAGVIVSNSRESDRLDWIDTKEKFRRVNYTKIKLKSKIKTREWKLVASCPLDHSCKVAKNPLWLGPEVELSGFYFAKSSRGQGSRDKRRQGVLVDRELNNRQQVGHFVWFVFCFVFLFVVFIPGLRFGFWFKAALEQWRSNLEQYLPHVLFRPPPVSHCLSNNATL